MNLLDKVVNILNNRLFTTQLTDTPFGSSNVYGLSQLAFPTADSPQRPWVYWQNEPMAVDLNDSKNVTLYHRVTDVTMSNDNAGFGDSNGYVKAVFAMTMIFFAKRAEVGYSQEDLILKTSAALNYTFTSGDLSVSGLGYVRASVKRANSDSLRVFKGEYGANADCPLQFNTCYFGIEYQVEISATNECLACTTC